ncbi:low molecular weight phosphotyrosine protein phosphatase [Parahaliea sp. F7430]|uniref:protein-tyrosine-phosphatase n=1 Tax=Sediminihaliea albiluteola TaxID=2758564 RepID=A0A7W2YJK5_9GAMM|nr:low molecular weight protein-tyrosine-phosphatase [Sediminihaliea albiluteola]MBA6412729.1 low molecular weight phosphotyrosine protein phosphatase [Sediminihaliea albiluteola]
MQFFQRAKWLFFPAKCSVMFVCKANLCRSPMAQGMLQHYLRVRGLSSVIRVESAGTEVSMSGRAPDPRAVRALAGRAIDIAGLRSRPLAASDFMYFDYVLALDEAVLTELQKSCPSSAQAEVKALLSFVPGAESLDVPDPYFGAQAGFEVVYQSLIPAIENLADDIVARLRTR